MSCIIIIDQACYRDDELLTFYMFYWRVNIWRDFVKRSDHTRAIDFLLFTPVAAATFEPAIVNILTVTYVTDTIPTAPCGFRASTDTHFVRL